MAQKPGELENTQTTDSAPNSDATNVTENPASGIGETTDANEATTTGTSDQTSGTPEIADDPEEIRQQIEETRASMSETIDAIGEKLSLANISEQVKEQVSEQIDSALETVKDKAYEATVGKAEDLMKNAGDVAGTLMKNAGNIMKNTSQKLSKSQLFKTAQDSPLPLILIGTGIGLLAYKSMSGKKHPARYDADGGRMRYGKYRSQSSSSSAEKSALSSAQQKVGDAMSGAYDSVSGAASDAYKGAGDLASQTYKKVGGYGTEAHKRYKNLLEEKPLVVGAIAAAVGAAIGLAIPATRYENELMGETKQNLLQQAKDSTGDLIGKAKDFVNDAGKNLTDEIKNQVSAQQK